MTDNMVSALWITLIGMGLVFAAILVLWGTMTLIIRLLPDRGEAAEGEEVATSEAEAEAAPSIEPERRVAAAAAAVAVALALAAEKASQQARTLTQGSPPAISPWRAVMRTTQYNQRRPVRR